MIFRNKLHIDLPTTELWFFGDKSVEIPQLTRQLKHWEVTFPLKALLRVNYLEGKQTAGGFNKNRREDYW